MGSTGPCQSGDPREDRGEAWDWFPRDRGSLPALTGGTWWCNGSIWGGSLLGAGGEQVRPVPARGVHETGAHGGEGDHGASHDRTRETVLQGGQGNEKVKMTS